MASRVQSARCTRPISGKPGTTISNLTSLTPATLLTTLVVITFQFKSITNEAGNGHLFTACCLNTKLFERSLKRFLPTNLGESEDKQWRLFEPQGQRNVKVQGMGVFFLVMPLAQTWLVRYEYMCFVCEITL
jgi:hypothetical protein